MEVAKHLYTNRITQAARLHGVETSGGDKALDGRRSALVIGGVEQHGAPRLSICARRERIGAEAAEGLHQVCVGGQQPLDHGGRGLAVGKRPSEPAVPVGPNGIRRIDDDLAAEHICVLRDQLPGGVQPNREHDGLRVLDRLPNRRRAGQRPQFPCQCRRV